MAEVQITTAREFGEACSELFALARPDGKDRMCDLVTAMIKFSEEKAVETHSAESGTRIFRAVITRTYEDGETSTVTYGPYDHAHIARGLISGAVNQARDSLGIHRSPAQRHTAKGHIEVTGVDWKRYG